MLQARQLSQDTPSDEPQPAQRMARVIVRNLAFKVMASSIGDEEINELVNEIVFSFNILIY